MTATAERVVNAACPHDCPDGCAMLVTVEGANGTARATRLVGNPAHPFTQGRLCVKVNNYLDRVYSDARVLYPMRRVGPKGRGRFARIGWDDALDEIAARFRAIADEYGPRAILPFSYLGAQGAVNGLHVGDAFFNKLGATVSERTFCDSGVSAAYIMTVGPTPGVDPESIAHARLIVLWAANPVSTNVHLWPFIREAQRAGAELVVIDPYESRSARYADRHLRIRPGTDGALALALINTIVAEGLVDSDYVERYTLGFDALAERAAQYPPEWAAVETGIAAEDIRRLARDFATTQPSVVKIGVALERQPGGGNAVRAITSLPALVGSWRHPGGGLCHNPLFAFPLRWNGGPGDAISRPDLMDGEPRILNQFRLGPALTGDLDLDPPIRALFVYNSNPAAVVPAQDRVRAGLARENLFTVVSEQFQTDTADYADILLPATTQLEQYELMFSWGHEYLNANLPAIAPLGEAVPNAELFRRLAARMGFTDECFGLDDRELARRAFDWAAPALAGIDLERVECEGWVRLNVPPPDAAPHAHGDFPTPSGRCEFDSSLIRERGNLVLPLFRQGHTTSMPDNRLDPVPDYIPPRRPAADSRFPLALLSPKAHAFLNSSYGNLDRQRKVQGEPTVTIHPADAAGRRIADGTPVRVFNDSGAFVARAEVSEAATPGIVVAPMGHWPRHTPAGAWVHAVIEPEFADVGNAPAFSDVAVQMERAAG